MNKTVNNFKINKSLINDLLVFYKPQYVDYKVVQTNNGVELEKRKAQERVYWETKYEEYLVYYQNQVGKFVKELIIKLKELDKKQKIVNLVALNFVFENEIIYWYTFVDYCTTPNLFFEKQKLNELIDAFWNNFNEFIGENNAVF